MKKFLFRSLSTLLLLSASSLHATAIQEALTAEDQLALGNVKKTWKNFPFKYVVDAAETKTRLSREQLMPLAWDALSKAEAHYTNNPQMRSNYTIAKAKLLFDPLFDSTTTGLDNVNFTVYRDLIKIVDSAEEIEGRNIHHARIWLAFLRYKGSFKLDDETTEDSLDIAWGYFDDAIRGNRKGQWTKSPILWQAEMIIRKNYAPWAEDHRLSRTQALTLAQERLLDTYSHSPQNAKPETLAVKKFLATINELSVPVPEKIEIKSEKKLPQLIHAHAARRELPATAGLNELRNLHTTLAHEAEKELTSLKIIRSHDDHGLDLTASLHLQAELFPDEEENLENENEATASKTLSSKTTPNSSPGHKETKMKQKKRARTSSLTQEKQDENEQEILKLLCDKHSQAHISNKLDVSIKFVRSIAKKHEAELKQQDIKENAKKLLLGGTSQAQTARETKLSPKVINNIAQSLGLTKAKKVLLKRNDAIDLEVCDMLKGGSSYNDITAKIGVTTRQISRISEKYGVRIYTKPNKRVSPDLEKKLQNALCNNDRRFSEVAQELGLTNFQVGKFASKHGYKSPYLHSGETKKSIAESLQENNRHRDIAKTHGVTKGYVDNLSYKMNKEGLKK